MTTEHKNENAGEYSSVLRWLFVKLLISLPVIGFITLCVLAFSRKSRDMKNYAIAELVIGIVGTICALILCYVVYLVAKEYIPQLQSMLKL